MGLALMAAGLLLIAVAWAEQTKSKPTPPEIIILRGNPSGPVKFRHRLHTDVREIPCGTCHHASKPQKPATADHQPCRGCHMSVAEKPMLTNIENAFHNDDATAGLCISCHRREDAAHKYKLAPLKCRDCHNQANALPEPTAGT